MEDNLKALQDIARKEIKEQNSLFSFYAVFFLSFVCAFVPVGFVAVFSVMICVCTLATIYATRSKSEEDSLTENHCSFLIRTFWRTNLYLLISAVVASLFLLVAIDYMPLKPCLSYIERHFLSSLTSWNQAAIGRIMNACYAPFMKGNSQTMLIGTILAIFPPLSYLIFRFGRGVKYLIRSKLLPDRKL